MSNILRDLRFSIRLMLRNRIFTAVAILTLALGIGANTAIFSVVNSILLQPLPYPDSNRLAVVGNAPSADAPADASPTALTPMSFHQFLDWKDQKTLFEEAAAYWFPQYNLTGGGEPERLTALRSSVNLLTMLGVKPSAGRLPRPDEELPSAERVTMITYGLWQRRFGGAGDVVGKTLTLDNIVYTIIGVLPRDLHFNSEWDTWTPLRLDANRVPKELRFLSVIGKLRPGLDVAQAQKTADPIAGQINQERGTQGGIKLLKLQDQVVGDRRPYLLVLLGAVGFVLLIACTNVANLLLTHALARHKEIAIRQAMGASRGRLVRQLISESLLLSMVSGVLGVLIGVLGAKLLAGAADGRLLSVHEVKLDLGVFAFAFVITTLAGLVLGAVPALQASKPVLHDALKEGGRSQGLGSGKSRLRGGLVVAEVAISLILLVGAGLLIRSFLRLLDVNKGFSSDHVLAMELNLAPAKYRDPLQAVAFLQRVTQQLSSTSGVEAAALVSNIPLTGAGISSQFGLDGVTWPEGGEPRASYIAISSEYFRTLQIPLIKGRALTEHDNASSPHVVLINETMAKRYFPNQDPIGKRVELRWGEPDWNEIVGVVPDVKNDRLETTVDPQIYISYLQQPQLAQTVGMRILAKTTPEPTSLVNTMRQQIYSLDKDQPISNIRTMDTIISTSVGDRLLTTRMLGALALVALFLAAVGIYGIMSYAVSQRTHELGIRMAIGAQRWDVLKLVLRQGMLLTLIGIVIGLVGALAISRIIASLLFGITPTDSLTLAVVSLIAAIAALLACLIPARRATRVDPMKALRYG